MTVISGHDLATSRDCKVPGCPNEAVDKRGPYALLCQRHKLEARHCRATGTPPRPLEDVLTEAAGEEVGEAPTPAPAPAPDRRSSPPSYEEKAKGLVKLGRRVDRAAAKARAHNAAGQAVNRAAAEALTAFKAAIRELAE